AYQTTVAAARLSTGVITSIKTDFVRTGSSGEACGDYFLVASPGDKIGRISMTLAYDGQSASFTIGETITGGTSGATAVVLQDSDSGTSGTLTLGSIDGTFQDNESLTGSTSGVAIANGTLAFTYTVITGAPKAAGITIIEARAIAFNLDGDESAVQYSPVDSGTNPPFDSWSTDITASGGGKLNYRRAGRANVVVPISRAIVIFAEKGVWAFQIDVIDSAGVLTKVDTRLYYELNGGGRAAL